MKRILSPSILLLLSVLFSLNVLSQEYDFQHLTTVDGLSHNEVRKIVKDSEGFLWLGTQNGLSRYDGYKFKVYKASNSDTTSLIRGDKIYALGASLKKIWVGSTRGLSIIDARTGKVLDSEIPNGAVKELKTSFIYSIVSDAKDAVWLSSQAGNFIINAVDYSSIEILKGYYVYSFIEGLEGNMWIGTNKGVVLYSSKTQKILETYGEIGHVEDFYIDKFGVLWAAAGNGVYRFVAEKNHFHRIFSKHRINAINESKTGDLLFSSYGGGLIVYSRTTESFYRLSANPKNQGSLSSNDLYDVLVDKEGLIWAGTQEGLDVCDWTRHRFKKLIHDPDNANSLGNNFVQTIYKDKEGAFWFGTRDAGLDRVLFEDFNYKKPIYEHFPSDLTDEEALWGSYISDVHEDDKNRKWIASWGNGLNLYDKKKKTFRHFTHNPDNPNSIASNQVISILEDHLGRIWLGTLGGLSLLIENEDGKITFRNFYHDKYNSKSLIINSIFKVYQDSKNRIWIGMNDGGLSLMHESTIGDIWFENFVHDSNDIHTINSNEVFVVFEDSKKRIWIGTSSAGMNLLLEEVDAKTGEIKYSFKRYSEENGLSDNEVNSLLEDAEGKLWIATNKGFSHFNPETENFINYTTYDGVLKGKFRKNSALKNTDGTLFFGGTAGINYFNPDKFRRNEVEPNPQFTELYLDAQRIEVGQKIEGVPVIKEALNSGTTLQIPSSYNRFKIHFTALSFASPLRNQFQYKLEEIDSDWKSAQTDNLSASYFDLPGGTYKFSLRVANNDGLWNSNPIYLNVVVASSFLGIVLENSGLLIAICTLILIGFIFKYRKRISKVKRKQVAITKNTKEKNIDEHINEENKRIVTQLIACMEIEKLYMNPLLNLQLLADRLTITSNQLSLVLNECVGSSFYDFVNSYRVEEVKNRLNDPKYKNQTLLAISGDCGFNSKSAFNRIFKNFTGKTPSQFQKELKK